jgi:hypothetical protein
MKLSKPREWTDQETRRLTAFARQKVGAGQIAHALGRYFSSVRKKAGELGLLLSKSNNGAQARGK